MDSFDCRVTEPAQDAGPRFGETKTTRATSAGMPAAAGAQSVRRADRDRRAVKGQPWGSKSVCLQNQLMGRLGLVSCWCLAHAGGTTGQWQSPVRRRAPGLLPGCQPATSRDSPPRTWLGSLAHHERPRHVHNAGSSFGVKTASTTAPVSQPSRLLALSSRLSILSALKPRFQLSVHWGFMAGNRITSLMLFLSAKNIVSRSTPQPQPPVGGRPCSSAVTKS